MEMTLHTLALFAQAEPELIWKSAPPRWAAFLLAVAAVAFVVGMYRGEGGRNMSPGVRWLLGLLRLAVLIAVFLVFCDPVYESKATRSRKSAIVVLVDESMSMTLKDRYSPEQLTKLRAAVRRDRPDEGGAEGAEGAEGGASAGGAAAPALRPLPAEPTRIEIINQLLDKRGGAIAQQLKQRGNVELYAFSSQLYPNIQPGKTDPRGKMTRLGDAFRELIDQPRDRQISSIVVLTDGQSNADEVPLDEVLPRLKDRKIKVYTIGVGSPVKPKDIELLQLRGREKVLVKDKVTFQVKLTHHGFPKNKSVAVRLEDISNWIPTVGTGFRRRLKPGLKFPEDFPLVKPGSRVLKSEPVTLGPSGGELELSMVHQFRTPGVKFIRVMVAPQQGEERTDNNQLLMRVEVRSDQLRVLFVDAFPRYEYRYLKGWLVRDPKIVANIHLASADAEFPQDKSPSAPPLHRLRDLTREDVMKYHVIILGDVNPRRVGSASELEDSRRFLTYVNEFVEKKGGGLILIAGTENNPKQLQNSPLEKAIPVRYVKDDRHADRLFKDKKRIERTPAAQGHPIFRLHDDPAITREMWQKKHVGIFMWYQKVKPVPGASVLAVHPDESYRLPGGGDAEIQRRKYPIFVLRNHGRGKVFFSAIDNTWRWRFLKGDEYFARFWAQVIRYVGSATLFGNASHYKLWTDRREYEPLERVKITLEVLDREFKPLSRDRPWKCRFRSPSGREGQLFLSHLPRLKGTYVGWLNANELGRWDLTVDKDPRQGFDEDAQGSFQVRIPNIESRTPELNKPELQQIAKKTGGEYFEAWEAQQLLEKIETAKKQRRKVQGISRSAWDKNWVLALILCLLGGEWLLRKLNRLQ